MHSLHKCMERMRNGHVTSSSYACFISKIGERSSMTFGIESLHRNVILVHDNPIQQQLYMNLIYNFIYFYKKLLFMQNIVAWSKMYKR
jgi:hypothetical protein